MPTLYEECVSLGIPTDGRYSDLYLPLTAQVQELIAKHKIGKACVDYFTCNITGQRMVSVFGAYDPFWHQRK